MDDRQFDGFYSCGDPRKYEHLNLLKDRATFSINEGFEEGVAHQVANAVIPTVGRRLGPGEFDSVHLEELRRCKKESSVGLWRGQKIRDFAMSLIDRGLDLDATQMPDGNLTRRQLFEYVRDPNNSTIDCVVTILAWGGMRRDHAQNCFAEMELVEKHC